MAKLFANSEDPDQTPRSAASDLGLHCLPITLLGVSQLKWVNTVIKMNDNLGVSVTASHSPLNDDSSIKDSMPIIE